MSFGEVESDGQLTRVRNRVRIAPTIAPILSLVETTQKLKACFNTAKSLMHKGKRGILA